VDLAQCILRSHSNNEGIAWTKDTWPQRFGGIAEARVIYVMLRNSLGLNTALDVLRQHALGPTIWAGLTGDVAA